MTVKQVKLKPDEVAVVHAIQRMCAALEMEAQQLATTYAQPGIAATLRDCAQSLSKVGSQYIADCQRSIVIAHELPNGLQTPP